MRLPVANLAVVHQHSSWCSQILLALTRCAHRYYLFLEFVDLDVAFGLHLDWLLEGPDYFSYSAEAHYDNHKGHRVGLARTAPTDLERSHFASAGLGVGRM